ncbi:MAG: type II secretion system protein [Candidatus Saccharimonadales bacterium]
MTKTSKQHGFTIVEVLIVLAISGLILMMVFMTVPTLQRNARNNERKQDVSSILQAISRWELNNSGGFPASGDKGAILDRAKRSYYTDPSSVTITPRTSEESYNVLSAVTDIDAITIANYAKCADDGSGRGIGTGTGYNDVVALFAVETRTSSAPQCQEL